MISTRLTVIVVVLGACLAGRAARAQVGEPPPHEGAAATEPPPPAYPPGDVAAPPPPLPVERAPSVLPSPPPVEPRLPDVRPQRKVQRKDEDAPAPTRASAPEPESSTSYSGQIVLADLGALVLGGATAAATGGASILLAWSLTSPVVHLVHGHGGRSATSLLLHVGLPLVGGVLGVRAEDCSSNPGQEEFCGLGGAIAGLGVGMVAATIIDAAVLARLPEDAPAVAVAHGGGGASAPAFTVGRNGAVNFGWRGTF